MHKYPRMMNGTDYFDLMTLDTKKLFLVERKQEPISLFLPQIDEFYTGSGINWNGHFNMYNLVLPETILFGDYDELIVNVLMINTIYGLEKFEEILCKLRDQRLLNMDDIRIFVFDAQNNNTLGADIKEENGYISLVQLNTELMKDTKSRGFEKQKKFLEGKTVAYKRFCKEIGWNAVSTTVYEDWIKNYAKSMIEYK